MASWLFIFLLSLTSAKLQLPSHLTYPKGFEPESADYYQWTLTTNHVRDLATILDPTVVLYCPQYGFTGS